MCWKVHPKRVSNARGRAGADKRTGAPSQTSHARFFAQKLQIQDVRDAIGEPKEGHYQILLATTRRNLSAAISAVGGRI